MRESKEPEQAKVCREIFSSASALRLPSGRENDPVKGRLEAAAAAFLLSHSGAEEAGNVNYLNLIAVTL